nr:sulfatase [Gemmatimonadaceae bacterium]
GDGTLAIRHGPWRLTPVLGSHGFSNPKKLEPKQGEAQGELFHLERDLEERDNRWLHEPEVVRRLTDLLDRARMQDRTR